MRRGRWGVYASEAAADEKDGRSYIITHIQNQLSFDLWYIFLGCFCICIAESGKIADTNIPVYTDSLLGEMFC
jgi:Cation transport protein.